MVLCYVPDCNHYSNKHTHILFSDLERCRWSRVISPTGVHLRQCDPKLRSCTHNYQWWKKGVTCETSVSPHEKQCMSNAILSKEICWKWCTLSLWGYRQR